MNIALPVLGGLGLFLYGMNLMGSGLQKAAGERLKKLIEVLTNNRLMGVLVGTLVTFVIQSSSATTVMVIGFVNAGLMTLGQAVGVIMGANIGTTVTAQLIAFDVVEYAPLAVGIGVAIWLVAKKQKLKDIAEIFIGFGILFIGMDMMGGGLKPLANLPEFSEIMTNLNNPVLGMLLGLGMTTIVQSSSASIGLLQALAGQGLININIAFPILFGDNIGTTTTALISSVGANRTAKRAAVIHFLFNLVGTIIFMTILRIPIQALVMRISPGDIQRQIANAHTFFNLINVIIQLPFANFLVKAAERLVPGEDAVDLTASKYLDPRIIETPSIAIGQVNKEIVRMGEIVQENLRDVEIVFVDEKYDGLDGIFEKEKLINKIESEITEYLVLLTRASLTDEQHGHINNLFNTINDIERVGDHIENIAELAQLKLKNNLEFSGDAATELREMFRKSEQAFGYAMKAFKDNDINSAKLVSVLEKEVDELEEENRANHIWRLNKSVCLTSAGIVYLDAISNLERVTDHSWNIAEHVIQEINNN
ncbi:Na/Pi cotransporter family protein [Tissierella sp. Yu-01]|uniref:Na/Pi cotransporter family protein n=1 Tax=Tissierella sp. Yu-01 TaxID=3035694 RepID=UPI00240DD0C4|nr:Na/Pi cotransporter family protein [Tissierella sp. Yu-01]WFA10216.1 Na/Pi cotransporter family protein [Tissierella sp. Yu-01]